MADDGNQALIQALGDGIAAIQSDLAAQTQVTLPDPHPQDAPAQ